MNIVIQPDANEPAYKQIHRQIRELIRDGLLEAGAKLPSVRDLAKSIGVSVTTIHTAFEALAAENLIETRQGCGTFVTKHPGIVTGANLRTREEMGGQLSQLPPMRWEPYGFQSDFFLVPESKSHTGRLIRFAQASPDPALFPLDRIKQIATTMLWDPKDFFFDRGHPQGYLPLVDHMEKEMALSGVPMAEGENDIILTGGFQRALSVILRRLLRPGQRVAVESPTYGPILNLLIAEDIGFVPIPLDKDGMDTEYLGSVLKKQDVQAIITIPTFHNPTGITMSLERREHLLRLAARHRVPVIEDDWGRALRYDGEDIPPLKAMDQGGYVVHIGTFSKCFLPGLRIGWITSPAGLSIPLLRSKFAADRSDSYFLQALLYEFILKGHYAKHLRKSLKEYKRRCSAMCKALYEYLPDGCRFIEPKGGFSIWVELPEQLKSLPLYTLAKDAGVQFLPAAFCMSNHQDASAFRLSFSRSTAEEIKTGVKLLCDVISRCLEQPELLEQGAKTYKDLYR